MKTQVFVIVPYDVPANEIPEFVDLLLKQSQIISDDWNTARWDYRVGALAQILNDPVAEGHLPADVRPMLSGNICDRCRLPPDAIPGALVTPDGKWHDLGDFGWRMVKFGWRKADELCDSEANEQARATWTSHFQAIMASYENCWIVEAWVHS
jgi:hypothetical protein